MSLHTANEFLAGLASWVEAVIGKSTEHERCELLRDTGLVFVAACDLISSLVVRRNSANQTSPSRSVPAVLPHEIVKLSPAEFNRSARRQAKRLEHCFTVERMEAVGDQHKELLRAVRTEDNLRSGTAAFGGTTPFKAACSLLKGRFPDLVSSCGSIATVFLGTSTVEPDFSILCSLYLAGKRRNIARLYRTPNSRLEGVLQTKQYAMVEALATSEQCLRALQDTA